MKAEADDTQRISRSKLSPIERAEIRRLYEIHRQTCAKAVCTQYGISRQTYHNIINGKYPYAV